MYGRITEESLRLEHRHSDGTWGRLRRVHHDPADHDPERDWAKGKIVYQCTSCDELVRVDDPSEKPGSGPEAGQVQFPGTLLTPSHGRPIGVTAPTDRYGPIWTESRVVGLPPGSG